MQSVELGFVQSQFAEIDLPVRRAELRTGRATLAGSLLETRTERREGPLATLGRSLFEQLAAPVVRVVEHVGNRELGRCRYRSAVEQVHDLRGILPGGPSSDRFIDLCLARHARRVLGQRIIFREIDAPDGPHETPEVGGVVRADDDIAPIGRRVGVGRNNAGDRRARRTADDDAVREVGYDGLENGEDGLEDRYVHHLPDPIATPRLECQEDAERGLHAGERVAQREVCAHRLLSRHAGQMSKTPECLANRRIPGTMGIRPGLAEARKTRDDQAAVVAPQIIRRQAPGLHRSGPEILDQHVGTPGESSCQRLTVRMREIQGDAALVARDGSPPVGGALIVELAPAADRVAASRRLHFDDLGPEVTEQSSGKRTGQYLTELENAQPGEWRRPPRRSAGSLRIVPFAQDERLYPRSRGEGRWYASEFIVTKGARAVRISLRTKLFFSHFLAVLLVSGSVGTYFYKQATGSLLENLRARLSQSAGLLARTLDARDLAALREASDRERPEYAEHLHLLRDFQSANPDVAFIYVMRLDDDGVHFVLDSDRSGDQAAPGDLYTEDVPRLRDGFARSSADEEIQVDRWGSFLSGYAPLKNGDGRFLVGLDMRADEVQRKFRRIRAAGALSLLASILLAALFSHFLASRITRPLRQVIARTAEIARGELHGELPLESGDELDGLVLAVNQMGAELLESQKRREQALADLALVNQSLETRIAERTERLSEVNATLLAEIEERKRAEARLHKAATSDYLTGLLNRPAMLRLLEQESERVQRRTSSYSLALADLDDFKKLNDRHGHAIGDRALAAIADILRAQLRGQDAVCRWGGDELLVFLPETNLTGAAEAADKIRLQFSEVPMIVQGVDVRLTVSVGVAEALPGEPVADVVHRADEALYRAKNSGRNQVARSA